MRLTIGSAQQRACWPSVAQISMKSSWLVGVVGAAKIGVNICNREVVVVDSLLTVCAVQVGKTEDIGGATLSVAVCSAADGELTSRYIGRSSCDDGAADEGCDDGCGKHVERFDVWREDIRWKGEIGSDPSRTSGRKACFFIPVSLS